jgi:hypothetical protein
VPDHSGRPPTQGNLAESWPDVLAAIAQRLGPVTSSLLTGSSPKALDGDFLTIAFPATGGVQREMCESNGRSDQIAAALSEHLGQPIRVRFEVAAPTEQPTANGDASGTPGRYKLLNDPAVKTVLVGLDATVTGIEEDPGP